MKTSKLLVINLNLLEMEYESFKVSRILQNCIMHLCTFLFQIKFDVF